MFIAVVVFMLLFAAACIIVVLYHRELSRITDFVVDHPASSNTRLGTALPLPGSEELVRAINVQLDEAALRERMLRNEEKELLSGLANLSHDIRTPLAGAKGYAQLARSENDPIEKERCLTMTEERLDSMQIMLDQLFDYTRAESSIESCKVQACDVVQILAQTLAGNYPSFAEKGWKCDIDIDDSEFIALVDPEALQRVYENLIANILKHGSGDVRISVRGHRIIFTNCVLPDAIPDVDHVFDRFYRGDDARGSVGAGLGLTIVKHLCAAMGIAVVATSENALFTIELIFN